jgi:hypothetical protein
LTTTSFSKSQKISIIDHFKPIIAEFSDSLFIFGENVSTQKKGNLNYISFLAMNLLQKFVWNIWYRSFRRACVSIYDLRTFCSKIFILLYGSIKQNKNTMPKNCKYCTQFEGIICDNFSRDDKDLIWPKIINNRVSLDLQTFYQKSKQTIFSYNQKIKNARHWAVLRHLY